MDRVAHKGERHGYIGVIGGEWPELLEPLYSKHNIGTAKREGIQVRREGVVLDGYWHLREILSAFHDSIVAHHDLERGNRGRKHGQKRRNSSLDKVVCAAVVHEDGEAMMMDGVIGMESLWNWHPVHCMEAELL